MATLGVLLAGGRSRRFGPEDKLLADFRGRPLVCHAAQALRDARPDALLAICGADAGALIGDDFIRIAARPDAGIGDHIAVAARRALESDAGRLLFHLGDMPLVPTAHLAALMAATGESRAAASLIGARVQVPACFARASFARLATLEGDRGARGLLTGAVTVALPEELARDIDTAGDLGPQD